MDAAAALADLTEICSQIEAAAVVGADRNVLATTGSGDGDRLADVGLELLEAADEGFGGRRSVTRLEVALRDASVFAVRERGLVLVARTRPAPASGLVLYDLGTCLQSVDAPARKPRRARKAQATADA